MINPEYSELVDAILTAYGKGREDGFAAGLDVSEIIHADSFGSPLEAASNCSEPQCCGEGEACTSANCTGYPAQKPDNFDAADSVFLEALADTVQRLTGRIELIERHYLGIDYTG